MVFEIAEGIIRADVREVRRPGLTMPAQRLGETGGGWPLAESNACKEKQSVTTPLIEESLSQHHIEQIGQFLTFSVFSRIELGI